MTIFPNPSKGNITLQAQTKENAQISVYDILGKEVYRTSQSLNSDINLKNLRSGVYLLRLEADGKQITKRLIIE
jgi:hypothetical protein